MFSTLPPDERLVTADELRDLRSTSVKTWIGGYRNRSDDWTEPRNWFPVGVPRATDRVIIGGYCRHRCRVASAVGPITALTVLPGATFVVDCCGSLTVDGCHADPLGLLGDSGVCNAGCLQILGALSILHANAGGIFNTGIVLNRGSIYVDASVTDCSHRWGHLTDLGRREQVG